MAQSLTVRAAEFTRNFDRYRDEVVEAKVINVTSEGRIIGGYLSASELARYEALKRRERDVLIVGELDEDTLGAIETAEYGLVPR